MQTKAYDILEENSRKEIVKTFNISMQSNLIGAYLKSCSEIASNDFIEVIGKNQKGRTVKVAGSSVNIEAMIQFKGIEVVERIAYSKVVKPLPHIPAFYNN